MKILITGAGGQVGQALMKMASDSAHELLGYQRVDLDICDAVSISRAFESASPDLVINPAAYTAVDRAESEPRMAHLVNAVAPGLLAQESARRKIPLLHVSTDYVFSGDATSPYTEHNSVGPLSVYGQTKEQGEQAVRAALAEHVILRTSWVFSETGSNFAKTMMRVAKQGKPLRVVDDQVGGPTSALSIAQALLAMADQMGQFEWGTYHFSQQPFVSWHQFAEQIFDQAVALNLLPDLPDLSAVDSSEFVTPVKRPANSCLDRSKFDQAISAEISSWVDDLTPQVLND